MRAVAVGFDPGLAHVGAAAVLIGEHPNEDQLLELAVFRTEKSDRKRGVMAADDDLRRAQEVATRVEDFIFRHAHATGGTRTVKVMCAEAMSFPRNARTSAQIALSWGVLAAALVRYGLPMCQAGPQEIRRRFGVAKGAAKEEVHALLLKRYERRAVEGRLAEIQELRRATEKQREELRRHPLDALAAIAAADGAEVMRLLRASS